MTELQMHGEECNIYLTYCKADATIKEEIGNHRDCVTGNGTGGLEDERKCGISAWHCGRAGGGRNYLLGEETGDARRLTMMSGSIRRATAPAGTVFDAAVV